MIDPSNGNLDLDTFMFIDPATGDPVTGDLVVAGEGTWSFDPATGEETFTPEPGFEGNPTPINYIAADVLGVSIEPVSVTITYVDAPAPVLAFNGVESWQMFIAALLAVGAGMALVMFTRPNLLTRKED